MRFTQNAVLYLLNALRRRVWKTAGLKGFCTPRHCRKCVCTALCPYDACMFTLYLFIYSDTFILICLICLLFSRQLMPFSLHQRLNVTNVCQASMRW